MEAHSEWLDERVDALRESAAESRTAWPDDTRFDAVLRATLVASDYAFEQLRRRPAMLAQLSAPAPRASCRDIEAMVAGSPDDLGGRLRRYRHAHSLRIIGRDVGRRASLEETLADTSRLAEICLDTALQGVEAAARQRREPLQDRDGKPLRLAIVGMGKLGGEELNFSSDIDLIFVHADPARSCIDDAESGLARIGQRVINLLSNNEADGFVHRVDMRLRPFGSVGRLAMPQSALEQYYQREGRDWERYAWVKARAVAGDRAAGERAIAALRPFVFRRYLDYAAIDSLREMKALIDAEVARADRRDDLKLGPGGIREVEFLVQLTQLTRGGREPALAVPGLLQALAAARDLGAMPSALADMLAESYRFLRQVENRVQMLRDEQTHRVPDAPVLRERLATGLGFGDFAALDAALQVVRQRVEDAFGDALAPSRIAKNVPVDVRLSHARALWSAAWTGQREEAQALALGLDTHSVDAIVALAGNANLRALPERHAARRDRLLPALIAESTLRTDNGAALTRLLALARAISGRPSYIALLDEQPGARERVVDVFARSGFLADQVIAHPLLLDDLLDERQLNRVDAPLDVDDLEGELARRLAMAEGDPEEAFGELHEFKLARLFRIGLDWLAGRQSADATSAQLAALAQVLAGAIHDLARADAVAQHGELGAQRGDGLLLLGYGSLGAAELGFASDLDLVFVYDSPLANEATEGERPVDGARWFARRAQRVVHWSTAPSRAGALYAVDTRLRPDGGKGLLVSPFDGYADYQRARAWTWEQQALVRARPVAGDSGLSTRFATLRRELLCTERDTAAVRADVLAMRARWRKELDRSDAQTFDLKQGVGGLVDLEFLLQFLVLAHAAQHPDLTHSTRTRELIAIAASCALIDAGVADALADAHEALLSASLDCTLDGRPRRQPRSAELDASRDVILSASREHGLAFD